MVGPLLVRYNPVDLEFTVLRWLPGAFWYLLFFRTASVVAFDSGILRLRRGGGSDFQLAVERESKAKAETGSL